MEEKRLRDLLNLLEKAKNRESHTPESVLETMRETLNIVKDIWSASNATSTQRATQKINMIEETNASKSRIEILVVAMSEKLKEESITPKVREDIIRDREEALELIKAFNQITLEVLEL